MIKVVRWNGIAYKVVEDISQSGYLRLQYRIKVGKKIKTKTILCESSKCEVITETNPDAGQV